MAMATNKPLSKKLYSWLQSRPRFETYFYKGTDSRAWWDSAMDAGVVQMEDVHVAPTRYFEDYAHRWASLGDFKPHLASTWKIIKQQYQARNEFALHNVWYAWSDKHNWDMPKFSQELGKWAVEHFAGLFEEKVKKFEIDADAWMVLVSNLAQQHPNESIARAYLLAQHFVGFKVKKGSPEANRFFALKAVDDKALHWWTSLTLDLQNELQVWCTEKTLKPAPAIQLHWLKNQGPTKFNLPSYLGTMDEWWAPMSNADNIEAHNLRINKVKLLLEALPLAPDANTWHPFVYSWFNSHVCQALWCTSPLTETEGNANTYALLLDDAGILHIENAKGNSLQSKLLEAREKMRMTARLQEDATWLEGGSNREWTRSWWNAFLAEKSNNVKRINVVLRGVDKGFPITAEEKMKLWLRSALTAKTPKAFTSMLTQHFSLPTDADEYQALDAWLGHWFPGQGKLMTVAMSLGMAENRAELKKYLINALTNPATRPASLPSDFTVDISF